MAGYLKGGGIFPGIVRLHGRLGVEVSSVHAPTVTLTGHSRDDSTAQHYTTLCEVNVRKATHCFLRIPVSHQVRTYTGMSYGNGMLLCSAEWRNG